MKFFLCFKDKVLLFETLGMGLWIMDCWDSGATTGEGTQPVRGRTSSGLSTLLESPLSHRDLHFPSLLFRIARILEVFSNCTCLPILSSTIVLSSLSFPLPNHISSLFINFSFSILK